MPSQIPCCKQDRVTALDLCARRASRCTNRTPRFEPPTLSSNRSTLNHPHYNRRNRTATATRCAGDLVSRFREREESVKICVMGAYCDLVKQVGLYCLSLCFLDGNEGFLEWERCHCSNGNEDERISSSMGVAPCPVPRFFFFSTFPRGVPLRCAHDRCPLSTPVSPSRPQASPPSLALTLDDPPPPPPQVAAASARHYSSPQDPSNPLALLRAGGWVWGPGARGKGMGGRGVGRKGGGKVVVRGLFWGAGSVSRVWPSWRDNSDPQGVRTSLCVLNAWTDSVAGFRQSAFRVAPLFPPVPALHPHPNHAPFSLPSTLLLQTSPPP